MGDMQVSPYRFAAGFMIVHRVKPPFWKFLTDAGVLGDVHRSILR
jgi:hypothetical protein